MAADNTDSKQRGRPFTSGRSGNPAGRPKGARNATTIALETLLDGQAQALTQKAIDLALTGDIAALRICLDRILPPRKDRPVSFTLPPIESAQDAAKTVSAVLAAVAAGDLTPADAGEISKLIEAYVKAYETSELADRLDRLGADDITMIARNVEARIVKLEDRRRRPDEILLVWRKPGSNVQGAVSGAKFAPGDRVVCAEWFGEDPMPKPRWYQDRLASSLKKQQYDYIGLSIEQLAFPLRQCSCSSASLR